jgi:hypothetical protein
MVAACETQVPRPNFLIRSLQDCENGDASACAMLESLQNDKAKAEESNLGPDPRTQVEKNADAIMEGIRRGRQPLPSHVVRIAPTTGRDLEARLAPLQPCSIIYRNKSDHDSVTC